jgi:hypothetical protein
MQAGTLRGAGRGPSHPISARLCVGVIIGLVVPVSLH